MLVDDQALIRSGFRMMIEAESDIEVVAEANNGQEAFDLCAKVPCDVIVMDIRMPVLDGVEATSRILAVHHDVRIVILTTFDSDEYVFAALRAGASGFLLKDARATELIDAIRSVASGEAVVAPSATKRLLEQFIPTMEQPPAREDPRLSLLTDRERDVLIEIARGATNAEIAVRLTMAEGTVKTHINRILSKLQIRDRVGLVLFSYDVGLIKR
ncbi:MAG: response regulator transcription factor [Propionibacteriaceae bacterium]|jgi:DNA-binding NarL/FixJ family response regulator|nr:response regulator transcription factor [Propionibacteriaceae bacterium]